MNKKIIIIISFVLFSISAFAENQVLRVINKGVKVRELDSGKWNYPDTFLVTKNNSTVFTNENGQADIILADSSIIFIDTKTIYKLENKIVNNKNFKVVSLDMGTIIIDKIPDINNQYIVSTPLTTSAVRGTIFAVETNKNKTKLAVFRGKVSVKNKNGEIVNVTEKKQVLAETNKKMYLSDLDAKMLSYYDNKVKKMLDRSNLYRIIMLENYKAKVKKMKKTYQKKKNKMLDNYEQNKSKIDVGEE